MKTLNTLGFALALLVAAGWAHAADPAAGQAKAAACMACHGANGVSVAADIPNLAGQKPAYLKAQLTAFRKGDRKNPLMNAMAGQLNDADIDNLVAFFSGLTPGTQSAKAPVADELAKPRVSFPKDYKTSFTHYTAINFPDRKQVRHYYANAAALAAAKAGKDLPDGSALFVEVFKAKLDGSGNPITGADGVYQKDELVFFTAMERQAGWGDAVPAELRNENWLYAVFGPDGAARTGVNQAPCLACHKPLTSDSYVFTIQPLKAQATR